MNPRAAFRACLLLLLIAGPFTGCADPAVDNSDPVFVSHDLANSGSPRLRVGFYAVNSAEELVAAATGTGVSVAPDFSKTRLAVLAPEFTSGSMGLEFLGVVQEEHEYVVQYRIHLPEIGTMDMAYPAILVEVPKDSRTIRFEQAES